jgi:hypothetical protein
VTLGVAVTVPLTFLSAPAEAATQTLPPQTFSSTWAWTGADFASPTSSSDQRVVGTVSGITSDNRNGAVVLREGSGHFLRAQVKQSAVTLEDDQGVLTTAVRPGPSSVTSGTLDATVSGSTVTVAWNGDPALSYALTRSYPGRACGVQVWQDVARSVTIGGSCDDAGAAGGDVGWLSGASGPQASDGSFGTWRGTPVAIDGTWINSADAPTLEPGGELGNWTQPVDIGVAPPDWQGWAAEANGVHDTYYHQLFAKLAQLRAGRGTTYVRPWYEFNGNWMDWSVGAGDVSAFKAAWIRMAGIARQEFPGVKLVFCASAANGSDVYSEFPGQAYVDVGGIDFYNNYPWVTTQAGFDDKADNGAGASSLNDLTSFYAQHGLPVAIDEWGNEGAARSAADGGGGESPQFIDSMHAWMEAHAGVGTAGPGQLLYEIYFNLYPDQFQLFPSDQTVQPQTAAEYARLF